MPTTKNSGTTKTSGTTKRRAPRAKADQSLVARTGRTVKERPYTSAAIATGAIAVAAAAAAGAVLISRRDKTLRETGEDLTTRLKEGFADVSDKVKELIGGEETKTQQEIAQEALTLKEIGATNSPVDELAANQIKTGAISY